MQRWLGWVKGRHRISVASCPLYPGKRTSLGETGMSALCQKPTSGSTKSRFRLGAETGRQKAKLDACRSAREYTHNGQADASKQRIIVARRLWIISNA
jgi:hypothetical protein